MAAEPWEGNHGASSDCFSCLFFDRNRLTLIRNRLIWSYGRCFYGILGVLCVLCAEFRADRAVWGWVVLVVVFHTGLWQPWRASIFSVLLASVALTLTVDEDLSGLQAFLNHGTFSNLILICDFFYSLLFFFYCDKSRNSDRESNISFIGYDLSSLWIGLFTLCSA